MTPQSPPHIFLSPPHMGGNELKYVQEAFATNWVSPAGPHLDAFEKELCLYNDVGYAAALSSGTAAIHLALIMLNIQRGDEVICSSFTFAGSCNPIAYMGATPVFIDSDAETWNMSPSLLEAAIQDRVKKGKKPKAIILVHLYGMPAQLDQIMEIAGHYHIPVIEDAAEAIGSTYQGKKLGTFGDIGVYSFNGNKIITTSGGGAMVSDNAEWVQKAKFLSTQARDAAPHYEHSQIGYNYRLSNISAAIGRGQLEVLNERIKKKREIFQFYVNALQNHEVGFQPEKNESFSNRWLSCVVFPVGQPGVREKVRLALEAHNIESRPLWKPMHLQPVFADAPYYGSGVSDDLFNRGLCLPSGTAMDDTTLDKVCDIILKCRNS